MKIQPHLEVNQNHTMHTNKAAAPPLFTETCEIRFEETNRKVGSTFLAHKKTADSTDFSKILNSHMQTGGITGLVKDALVDVTPEILQEIEKLTEDQTGQHIDMDALDGLLNLLTD